MAAREKKRAPRAAHKEDEGKDVWLTLRLPPELHGIAKELSELDDRSLNAWLVRAVAAFAETERTRLKPNERRAAAR